MATNDDVDIDVSSFNTLFQSASNNFDDIQGYSLTYSAHSSRTLFISSSEYKESYAKRLKKQNNKMDKNELVILFNSKLSNGSQLEYVTSKSQTG